MVDVKPANEKLVARCKGIISQATGCDAATAEEYYEKAGHSPKIAICMYKTGYDREKAVELLQRYDGHLKQALRTEGFE